MAQNLLGATLGIYRAKRLLPALSADAAKALDDSCELIEQSQREIPHHCLFVASADARRSGPPDGAELYIDGFVKRSGIAVDLSMAPELEDHRLPYDVETALFRVLQEALTNVHRHSGSQVARVTLDAAENTKSCVVLDGRGRGQGYCRVVERGPRRCRRQRQIPFAVSVASGRGQQHQLNEVDDKTTNCYTGA